MDLPITTAGDAKISPPPKPIANRKSQIANRTGNWSLRDLSGSIEGVTRAVDAAPDVPEHWKAAIKADLALRCAPGAPGAPGGGPKFNFVYLDAHFFIEGGNATLHYTATPDQKLL